MKQARQERERTRQQKEAQSEEKESAIRARRVEKIQRYAKHAQARKRAGTKAKEEEARLKKKRAKLLADQRALYDQEKNELIEAKMRPFFKSQEDSEGCEASFLKVHTYESAVLDLRLKGIESIGQTWARLSAENGFEVGPHDEIRHIVECSQDQWKIPTYEDGVGVDVVVIGPPREWYDHNGFDDSDFDRAFKRWELLTQSDQALFEECGP